MWVTEASSLPALGREKANLGLLFENSCLIALSGGVD